ncbi:MAG: orotidine-5'-phosphate decarboxylase [Gammaproteobacteria bacterium]|nr:orotidine-5'-phosphate decarboxylase [Gammaproteobacteria bacterium]MCI0590392.1 orotidine-5'-phosphate decarboxylase [Gammaproteobacteria bacterium]
MNEPRIIVALDYGDPAQALKLAKQLDPMRCKLKVGGEVFTRSGPAFVEQCVKMEFDVFLDLKFHDIPTTVAEACAAAADLGVWMVNVHAMGGTNMMRAARESIDRHHHHPLLVAVTVLTSLSDTELVNIGIEANSLEETIRLAELANDAGMDGVVCSPRDVAELRRRTDPGFCLVTPGIRPAGAELNDQKRFATPADALRCGANYLVIGRPITRAHDPLQALHKIETEINVEAPCAFE